MSIFGRQRNQESGRFRVASGSWEVGLLPEKIWISFFHILLGYVAESC